MFTVLANKLWSFNWFRRVMWRLFIVPYLSKTSLKHLPQPVRPSYIPSYNSYSNYAFKTYGPLANRPLHEIMRKANKALVKQVFGWDTVRYADNAANRELGYVNAERAVWLTSITAKTTAELTFAWQVEITLANTTRDLNKLCNNVK